MERLEEPRKLVRMDAGARVAHPELHALTPDLERDLDLALEGELVGVREEVLDDLLPHFTIDEHCLWHALAAHAEAQTGSLQRTAELTGELGRDDAEIERLEADVIEERRLHANGLARRCQSLVRFSRHFRALSPPVLSWAALPHPAPASASCKNLLRASGS
jgi:hypothetical protein